MHSPLFGRFVVAQSVAYSGVRLGSALFIGRFLFGTSVYFCNEVLHCARLAALLAFETFINDEDSFHRHQKRACVTAFAEVFSKVLQRQFSLEVNSSPVLI